MLAKLIVGVSLVGVFAPWAGGQVDYRAQQSAVKDQGRRGTCAAFSVCAAMETFPGVPTDLSEQILYATIKLHQNNTDLWRRALGIDPPRRACFARGIDQAFLRRIERERPRTLDALTVARPSRHLLWLDMDVVPSRPFDARFWAWTSRFGVATIGSRPPHHPETGVLALADSPAAHARLRRAAKPYVDAVPLAAAAGHPMGHPGAIGGNGIISNGSAASAAVWERFQPSGGANDIQVFGHLLASRGRMAAARRLHPSCVGEYTLTA